MTDFGASFKKARQAMGLTLDQISRDTRISTRFLQAIENEEFHVLPGGIFNRGFIKAYAERVGLDTERVVADYDRLVQPEVQETPEPTVAPPEIQEKAGLDRYLYPIALGALLLLILIYYLLSRDSGPAAQLASEPTRVVAERAGPEPPPVPAPSQSPEPAAPGSQSVPAVNPSPRSEARTESATGEALIIEFQILETTWIKVSTDGAPATGLEGEILEPGATRRFTAHGSVDLVIGNAGGVILTINGQEVQSLGRSGRVRQLQITPENYRNIVGN